MSRFWDILSGKRIRESHGNVLRTFTCKVTIRARQRRPKPRVRIMPGGWIRHQGGPFPFDGACLVELILAGGCYMGSQEPANRTPDKWWRGEAEKPEFDVMFYRIVAPRRRWSEGGAR